jgi:hypothetical protein
VPLPEPRCLLRLRHRRRCRSRRRRSCAPRACGRATSRVTMPAPDLPCATSSANGRQRQRPCRFLRRRPCHFRCQWPCRFLRRRPCHFRHQGPFRCHWCHFQCQRSCRFLRRLSCHKRSRRLCRFLRSAAVPTIPIILGRRRLPLQASCPRTALEGDGHAAARVVADSFCNTSPADD